jgi:hypothetical protein
MAVRWLGGEASDALTGDAGLLDLVVQQDRYVPPTVLVQRQSQVSHRAMMSQQQQSISEDESPYTAVDCAPAVDRSRL